MKNLFLLFIMMGTSLYTVAKDRIVKNPAFEVSNTGITNITKIELKNNETCVHIHTTFLPNWWVKFSKKHFIKDSNSGEKLYATAIIGGEFDKEIFMKASGDSSFVLVFPAINKTIKKIDFGEDDKVSIFGISLDSKQKKIKQVSLVPAEAQQWIDAELAKAKVKTLVDYASPQFFSHDTARLVGYIKGYDPRLDFYTGMIYSGNVLTREDFPVIVRIHDDGRFEADIPMIHPEYTYVVFKGHIIKFYLEPGQVLSMVLNWDEFLIGDRLRNSRYLLKDVAFGGPVSKINEELLSANLKPFDYKEFQKSVETLSPEQFKKQQMTSWQISKDDVEGKITINNFSLHTQKILRNEVAMENASLMFDYVMNRESALRKDTVNQILKIKPEPSYYDFLQQLDLNDQSLLLASQFSTFINRFEFSKPISNVRYSRVSKPKKTLRGYLFKDLKLSPTKEDLSFFKKELDIKLKSSFTEVEKDQLIKELNSMSMAFHKRYQKHIAAFGNLYPQPKPLTVAEQQLQSWQRVDSAITNYYNLAPNLVYEIAKVRSLKFTFEKMMKKDEAISFLASFEKGISNPFLAQEANRIFYQSYPTTPLVAYDLPPGKATEIFRKIIEPHKGKMLFVDFWGIFCGPCIGSIKSNKVTREKYKDSKDLEFLFITSTEDSPQKRYDEFVKDQELENTYKLSADDYRYLRQLFKFNGIPRYIVVNKDGRIMNDDFQMHNFESELKQLLTKQ